MTDRREKNALKHDEDYIEYVKMLTLLAKARQAGSVDEIQARDIEKEIHRVYKVPFIPHSIHPAVGKNLGENF